MAEYVLIPVTCEDAEAAGITEHAVIESFINERGEIIIRTLSEADDYVCGYDCESCIFDKENCEKWKQRDEPYVCRGHTVNPAKGGENL